jgi:hypothetical protein
MFPRTFTGIIASSKGGGVVLTQGILYDDANYYPQGNGPDACNPPPQPPPTPPPMPMPIDIWYTGTAATNDFIYFDSAGTIPFNGFFSWWKINAGFDIAVQVDTNGQILDTFSC